MAFVFRRRIHVSCRCLLPSLVLLASPGVASLSGCDSSPPPPPAPVAGKAEVAPSPPSKETSGVQTVLPEDTSHSLRRKAQKGK
jgi:hypothetical protein